MAGGALKVQYTGAQASCLLIGDKTAKTLTAKIGAAGAEAPDAGFGIAGVLDLTAAAQDTLLELKNVIDGYADYSASIHYGDEDIVTEHVLDQINQAKGTDAYLLFSLTSVLAAHALVSWEFVKEMLPDAQDTQQLFYERLINAASPQANRIAGRRLKAVDYTEILDGTGDDSIVLPEYPANAITSLYIDTARAFGAATEVTDYLLYSDVAQIVLPSRTFPDSPQCVKVLYNAGLNPVPEDLEIAVLEVVVYNRKRLSGQGNIIGMKSSQVDSTVTMAYELTIPANAQRVFESYRRAG